MLQPLNPRLHLGPYLRQLYIVNVITVIGFVDFGLLELQLKGPDPVKAQLVFLLGDAELHLEV